MATLRNHSLLAGILLGLGLVFALYPRPRREAHKAGVTDVVFWLPPGYPTDKARPAVEEFERRNPAYRVVMGTASVRDATGDPTRFLLGVAGGVPPDLIFFDRFAVVEWASRGAFTDLKSPARPLVNSGSIGIPAIARAATFTQGIPVALLINGTVREALGLTSRQYATSSFTANWTLIIPTIFNARAISLVYSSSRQASFSISSWTISGICS